MDWKHLLWVVPLCLFLGWGACYVLQSGTSMLGWELSKDCYQLLLEERAFSEAQNRCLFETRAADYEFCYWEGVQAMSEMVGLFDNVTG